MKRTILAADENWDCASDHWSLSSIRFTGAVGCCFTVRSYANVCCGSRFFISISPVVQVIIFGDYIKELKVLSEQVISVDETFIGSSGISSIICIHQRSSRCLRPQIAQSESLRQQFRHAIEGHTNLTKILDGRLGNINSKSAGCVYTLLRLLVMMAYLISIIKPISSSAL